MLNNILNKFSDNKKSIFTILLFVFIFFAFNDSVFAADKTAEDIKFEELKTTFASVVKWISSFITVFLSLLTYLGVMFLSPEWISGSLFGLNSYFKQIWILMSNLVYFVFAFIIIWIAFMNIIGKGQDKYALKQALPKFVVGILIVPFSWFLVNFILAISAILTVSAINIPFDTFKGFSTVLSEIEIPNECILNLKSTTTGDATNVEGESGGSSSNTFFSCTPGKVTKMDVLMNSGESSDSIVGVLGTYTYGIIALENISKLSGPAELASITTIGDLVVKIVFDLFFVLVYSVLMIALTLVLLVRGIYIWVYIMISPVFGLMYFFDKSSGGGEFFDKFNIKQFISLAMVPVYTMLALSFGLLFMFVVAQGMTVPKGESLDNVKIVDDGEKGSKITIGGDNSGENGFSLTIIGSPANPQNITGFAKSIGNDALGVIGTLIMKIFGIVILWGAVMAALRSNDITKAVVEPLHQFGGQIGQLAAKAPQYAPIFGGQSMTSMSQIGSAAQTYYSSTKPGENARKFMEKNQLFGNQMGSTLAADKLSKTVSSGGDVGSIAKEIRNVIKENGESGVAYRNTAAVNSLLEAAVKLGIDSYKGKNAGNIKNAEDYVELIKSLDGNLQPGGNDIIIDGRKTIESSYTKHQFDEYIRGLKNGTQTQDPPVGGNPGQPITLNIKNGENTPIPVTLNNVTLTDEQKTDISSIDISSINKKTEIVNQLKNINGLTDEIIEDIIKAIDPTGVKFTE